MTIWLMFIKTLNCQSGVLNVRDTGTCALGWKNVLTVQVSVIPLSHAFTRGPLPVCLAELGQRTLAPRPAAQYSPKNVPCLTIAPLKTPCLISQPMRHGLGPPLQPTPLGQPPLRPRPHPCAPALNYIHCAKTETAFSHICNRARKLSIPAGMNIFMIPPPHRRRLC